MTFIAIEGIDGTGKSTLSRRLKVRLEAEGFKVFATYEPYGDPGIRKEWITGQDTESALKLAIRFISDRVLHSRIISEKIRNGYVVISDRYFLSTAAYQGILLKRDLGTLESTLSFLLKVSEPVEAWPDCTILMDVDPEVSIRRIAGRRDLSPFEQREYLNAVRSFYMDIVELVSSSPEEWGVLGNVFTVNSGMSRKQVMEESWNIVKGFLPA